MSRSEDASYPRDMHGYGSQVPAASWPNGAKVAVQFVLNYEEGAENCILHGDAASETFLSEIIGAVAYADRHMSMESLYEYGSRVGVWRVLNLFAEYDIQLTVFAVAMAIQRNPDVAEAMLAAGHEIASHGWRWIDYQSIDAAVESEHIHRAVDVLTQITGERPWGWYTGRTSPNTRRLVAEYGGFLYDADSYADELPYWEQVQGQAQLIVPYTLDCNDMRFATHQGFNSGEQFFTYLKDSFDVLYAEGEHAARMMSVGLHGRIVGRPGRIAALRRFIDYIQQYDDIWVCRRVDIARHWRKHQPWHKHHDWR